MFADGLGGSFFVPLIGADEGQVLQDPSGNVSSGVSIMCQSRAMAAMVSLSAAMRCPMALVSIGGRPGGGPIRVAFYDDRVYVESLGGLLPVRDGSHDERQIRLSERHASEA